MHTAGEAEEPCLWVGIVRAVARKLKSDENYRSIIVLARSLSLKTAHSVDVRRWIEVQKLAR